MPTFLLPALSNVPPMTSSPFLPSKPSCRALAFNVSSRRSRSALASFLSLGSVDFARSAAVVANSEAEERMEMISE